MSESDRDNPMSSEDAAELEELRREAAMLREQLEEAVGPNSGLRSARDVHQLEARIDSLAARELTWDDAARLVMRMIAPIGSLDHSTVVG